MDVIFISVGFEGCYFVVGVAEAKVSLDMTTDYRHCIDYLMVGLRYGIYLRVTDPL